MRCKALSGCVATWLLSSVGLVQTAQAQTQKADTAGWEFKDTPAAGATAAATSTSEPSEPADEREQPGYLPGYRREIGLGLSPFAPGAPASLPGTLQPAFGAPNLGSGIGYEFHGYMQQPLRASFGSRAHAYEGQHSTVIHGDPVLPGANYGWFSHTMTVPTPWAHLGFTVGNRTVKATMQVGSWSPTESDDAAGYFRTPSKVWFNSAFLTYTPNVAPVLLRIVAGAYPERYGAMSRYTQGAYATSVIGTVFGGGSTATVELPFEGDFTAKFEAGFKGDFNRVPNGCVGTTTNAQGDSVACSPKSMYPNGSNEWARPWYGSTYVPHGHFGINYAGFDVTGHYIYAFAQDDRSDKYNDSETFANEAAAPHDGHLAIAGADVRWDGKRFGYAYLGVSHVDGYNTNRLSDTVSVINSGGGAVLMERFWGFGSSSGNPGTGKLTIVGGQYSVSLGTLLRYPTDFTGEGPDLTVSVFGLYVKNQSANPQFQKFDAGLKYGAEGIYSCLPWFAPSLRLDHVMQEMGDSSKSFFVASPRLVFRSDWASRESITLQYSGYVLGKNVTAQGDGRLMIKDAPPDKHFLTVYGTLWW